MTEVEATAKIREFVRANTSVDYDPDWIKLSGKGDGPLTWTAYYSAVHFYPAEIAAEATIDGGEYIV